MNLQKISRDDFIALLNEPDLLASTKAVNHLWIKPEPTALTDDVYRLSERTRLIDNLAPFYQVDIVLSSGWVNFLSSSKSSVSVNVFSQFMQRRLAEEDRYSFRSMMHAPCQFFVDRTALPEHSFRAYLREVGGIELSGYCFTRVSHSDIVDQLQNVSKVSWLEIELWDSALKEDRVYRCLSNPPNDVVEKLPEVFKSQYPEWMTLTKITGHSLETKSTESLLWATGEDTPLKGVTYGLS